LDSLVDQSAIKQSLSATIPVSLPPEMTQVLDGFWARYDIENGLFCAGWQDYRYLMITTKISQLLQKGE